MSEVSLLQAALVLLQNEEGTRKPLLTNGKVVFKGFGRGWWMENIMIRFHISNAQSSDMNSAVGTNQNISLFYLLTAINIRSVFMQQLDNL
jgi:hypothetical protein